MAISLVTTAKNDDASGGTLTSLNSSPSINLPTGNLLVVSVRQGTDNSTNPTVTDTAGNTFTPIISASLSSTDMITLFYAKNTKSNASDVVTAHWTVAQGFVSILVLEYSGCDTTAPLDASTTGVVASPSTASSVTSSTFSTAQASEVAVAAFSVNNLNNTFTAGAGFTIRVTDADAFTSVEDQIYSSIQTNVTASASDGTFSWEMVVATFKAAGGSTTKPYPPFQLGVA